MATEYKKIEQFQGTLTVLNSNKRAKFLAYCSDDDKLYYSKDGVNWIKFANESALSGKIDSNSFLTSINQNLGTTANVVFNSSKLGSRVTIGSPGNTDWIFIGSHGMTDQGEAHKFYVTLHGGDFFDYGKSEFAFDSFSKNTTSESYNFRRISSFWKNSSNEIFSNIEFKAFRKDSDNSFEIYCRGLAVSYFQLSAEVKVLRPGTGLFQSFTTTTSVLPTTGYTELSTTITEAPVRILQDKLYLRDFNKLRSDTFNYGSLGFTSSMEYNGTSDSIISASKFQVPASTDLNASFKIPSGIAPSLPGSGDIWNEGAYLLFRNNTGNRYLTLTAGLGANKLPKASGTGLLVDSLLSDDGTNLIQNSGYFLNNSATVTDGAFVARINTDAIHRFALYADGKMEWGAGASSNRDTNLYRSAANTLKTDDSFEANALKINGLTGSRLLSLDASKNVQALDSAGTRALLGVVKPPDNVGFRGSSAVWGKIAELVISGDYGSCVCVFDHYTRGDGSDSVARARHGRCYTALKINSTMASSLTTGGLRFKNIWFDAQGSINTNYELEARIEQDDATQKRVSVWIKIFANSSTIRYSPIDLIGGTWANFVQVSVEPTGTLVTPEGSSIIAGSISVGGTSDQFLKANGSLDSTVYLSGNGTIGYLPKYGTVSTLANSIISDDGTTVSIGLANNLINPRLHIIQNSGQAGGGELSITAAGTSGDANSAKIILQGGSRIIGRTDSHFKLQRSNAGTWNSIFETTSSNTANLDLTFNGAILCSGFAGNKALISGASKQIMESTVTSSELGYLIGATSNIQNQFTNLSNSILGGTLDYEVGSNEATGNSFVKLFTVDITNTFTYANGSFSIDLGYQGRGHLTVYWSVQTALNQPLTNPIIRVVSNYGLDPALVKMVLTANVSTSNKQIEIWFNTPSAFTSLNLKHHVAKVANGTLTVPSLTWVSSISAGTVYDGQNQIITNNVRNLSLTPSMVLVSDASNNIVSSAVTSTELGYLDGVTSSIQTQINGKIALSSLLTGYSATSGTISASDSILSAFNKLAFDKHVAVTIGTANGLSLSTQAISLALASASTTGALSSTDWNTFNGKLNLSSALTGYVVGANTAIASSDSILGAFQKLQGQVNAKQKGFTVQQSLNITTSTGPAFVIGTAGKAIICISGGTGGTISICESTSGNIMTTIDCGDVNFKKQIEIYAINSGNSYHLVVDGVPTGLYNVGMNTGTILLRSSESMWVDRLEFIA